MKKHDLEEGTGLLSQRNCMSVNSATEQAVRLWASNATSLNLYFLICKNSDDDFYPVELVHSGNSTHTTSLSPLLHSFLQVRLKTERKKLDIFFTCKSFWQMCLCHHAFRNTEKGSRIPVTTHSDPQLASSCWVGVGSAACQPHSTCRETPRNERSAAACASVPTASAS